MTDTTSTTNKKNNTPLLNPVYRIQTPRLILRCYQPSDAPALKDAIDTSIDHLQTMVWIKNEPQTIEDKRHRIRSYRGEFDIGKEYVYGIFEPDGQTLLGSMGLHNKNIKNISRQRDIGYRIRASHIGQGFTTEAAQAITMLGMEWLHLESLIITCDEQNPASARVAEKLGYTYEGTIRDKLRPDTARRNKMIRQMKHDEYTTRSRSLDCTRYDIIDQQITPPIC